MPGANYMGGKRNAMKARVKDTVGRQQKTFFGHRRLDLLSQGLSASKTSGKPQLPSISLSSNRGRPDIDLAHARQKIPLEEDADVYSYIPKAVHISPSTPDSRRRLKTTHTSSFHGPRSKVLDAVDAADPSLLRRTLDEILAMPDLACLSTPQNCPNGEEARVERKRKRSDIDIDFNPRCKIEIKKRRTSHEKNLSENLQSSPQRQAIESNLAFNYEVGRSMDVGAEHTFPSDDMHSMNIGDDGFSDPGEMKSWKTPEHQQTPSVSSSHYSEGFHRSPSPISPTPSVKPPSRRHVSGSLKKTENKGSDTIETAIGLPSCVNLRPMKEVRVDGGKGTLQTEQCVFGNLFEQIDPWSTVGQILGIEDKECSQQLDPQDFEKCINCAENIYSFYGKDGYWDNIYEPDEEEEGTSDVDSLLNDYWCTDRLVSYSTSSPFLEPPLTGKSALPETPSQDQEEDADMRMLNFEEGSINRLKGGYSRPQISQVEFQRPYESSASQPHEKPRDAGPTSLVEPDADALEIKVSTEGIDQEIQWESQVEEEEEDDGARMLGTPELQEINGRFAGPSLFSRFEKSDDDL